MQQITPGKAIDEQDVIAWSRKTARVVEIIKSYKGKQACQTARLHPEFIIRHPDGTFSRAVAI